MTAVADTTTLPTHSCNTCLQVKGLTAEMNKVIVEIVTDEVKKSCAPSNFKSSLQKKAAKAAAARAGASHACADEGETCKCTGKVVYGRKFVSGKPGAGKHTNINQLKATGHKEKQVSGTVKCSYGAMGGDPSPGYYKYCLCETTKTAMSKTNLCFKQLGQISQTGKHRCCKKNSGADAGAAARCENACGNLHCPVALHRGGCLLNDDAKYQHLGGGKKANNMNTEEQCKRFFGGAVAW